MTTAANPLTVGALDEYIREVMDTHLSAAADGAALATAITGMDEGAAKDYRMRQLKAGLGQVRGRNMTIGQVASLAITNAGSGYEVGDKIEVTTSTGAGAAGRIATVDGSGAILTIELTIAGRDYDAGDTACTIDTVAGTSGVIEATIATNEAKILEDAFAVLLP